MTVKGRDYLRSTQFAAIIEEEASEYEFVFAGADTAPGRMLEIRKKAAQTDFSAYDVVILGFLPQVIIKRVMKSIKNSPEGKIPLIISDFFLSMWDTVTLDRRYVSPYGIIGRFLKKLDTLACMNSDIIVTDTKAGCDFICNTFGADRSKTFAMYLRAGDVFKSSDIPGVTNYSHGSNEAFNVLYFGTGLPLQGIDVILEAADMLSDTGNIRFTFIGNMGKKAQSSLNSNITFIDWLSQKELAEKISEADLCLAGHFNKDIDKADRTIPGKAYIYEQMGKPMILGDTRANRELFEEDGRHFFVPRGDSKALADLIKKICDRYNHN
ncbi:MAG: glycosyltransferase [Butyrivibrio sp.]|nr:glycosyltransferase [Butyrivibrio sp.]